MARYEIRMQDPNSGRSLIWDVERADDVAALDSAIELCRN